MKKLKDVSMTQETLVSIQAEVNNLIKEVVELKDPYIGEVYDLEWYKFKKYQIKDEVDGYVKITYNYVCNSYGDKLWIDKWFEKEQIFYYKDFWKSKRKEIEARMQKKWKVKIT